jgi:putative membrane protein
MSTQTLQNILASIAYSAVGTIIFIVAYKVMERILPFNVDKELSEDHNTAVGILIGSIMIGLAIIIAASIH